MVLGDNPTRYPEKNGAVSKFRLMSIRMSERTTRANLVFSRVSHMECIDKNPCLKSCNLAGGQNHPYNASEEIHPYNSLNQVPENTRLLIVGTAPPPRFTSADCLKNQPCKRKSDLDFDFFYGSGENWMWEFLRNIACKRFNAKICTNEMTSDECRQSAQEFLRCNNIWMQDVLQTFRRTTLCSASDDHIDIEWKNTRLTDFGGIFDRCASLNTIAFTSLKAAQWTYKAFEDENLIDSGTRDRAVRTCQARQAFRGRIKQRHITFLRLPSPSGRVGKIQQQNEYEAILFGRKR